MSLEYYEIRCDYCGTEVASTDKNGLENSIGVLLGRLLELKGQNQLCVYHGECMVENYEINKVKTVKEREKIE